MTSPCVFRKRDNNTYLAFIEITNLCNMKCKHCMNWSVENSNEVFKRESIMKLIDELYENKTEKIILVLQ